MLLAKYANKITNVNTITKHYVKKVKHLKFSKNE